MPNKNSSVDEFLGDLNEVQEDPFNTGVDDNIFNPEEGAKEEVIEKQEEVVEEKALPFNKDPKVQRYIDKQVAKALEDFKPRSEEREFTESVSKNTNVDDVLGRLIGNDTAEKVAIIKEFKDVLENGTRQAKAEALAELRQQQEQELQADRDAENELEEGFESVEEHFGITFTPQQRKGFATFVARVAPKDEYGEVVAFPDFIETYDTYDRLAKASQSPSRAKELASRSMVRSGETSTKPQERITWDSVDRIFEK